MLLLVNVMFVCLSWLFEGRWLRMPAQTRCPNQPAVTLTQDWEHVKLTVLKGKEQAGTFRGQPSRLSSKCLYMYVDITLCIPGTQLSELPATSQRLMNVLWRNKSMSTWCLLTNNFLSLCSLGEWRKADPSKNDMFPGCYETYLNRYQRRKLFSPFLDTKYPTSPAFWILKEFRCLPNTKWRFGALCYYCDL